MATRNFVPRNDGEGSIGTTGKQWGDIQAKEAHIGGRDISTDGSKLDTHETAIDTLQTKVTTLEHAYAGAKAAATVADMTDQEQIYVYVGSETGYTNGNWYYWNGSAWTSGGVYNATALETDKTLTVSGAAADASVTGIKINDISSKLSRVSNSIDNDISRLQIYLDGYIVYASGYSPANGWSATRDYIPVNAGDILYTETTIFWAGFDDNAVGKSQATILGPAFFTIPSGVTMMKFAVDNSNMRSGNVHVCFDSYNSPILDQLKFYGSYDDNNLLRGISWKNGYYIEGDGLHENADYTTSNYINVQGIDYVIGSGSSVFWYVFYKEDNTVTGSGTFKPDTKFYLPANTTKMRISVLKSVAYYCCLSQGFYKSRMQYRHRLYVGDGMQFEKITDAIKYAYILSHCDVYVKSGTYDILTELGDISALGEGVFIGNDTNLYCETDTIITCMYEGISSANHMFSVLNCDDSDFLIENLTIKCKNIRYCVHDDPNTTTRSYTHKFINCHMEIDDTNNNYWSSACCIGAGLGHKGYIVVDGGFYKGVYGNTPQSTINYHGDSTQGTTDSKGKLIIKNVYFADNNTCGVSKYGTSQLLSEAFVSNCSMTAQPRNDTTNNDTGGWILRAWNNEIRELS